VERHLLTELIEVARYAPSGHNLQPARWLVVYDKEEVQRLAALVVDWLRDLCCRQPQLAAAMHVDRLLSAWEAGTDRICRGAPHLVMVHADERGRTAQTDGVIAMTYFDLMASARGLGTCWAGYFNRAATVWPPLVEALALPEGHRPVATMMVGYPRFRYRRLVPRRQPSISWR
jgi:nitroreductase